MVYGSSSQTVRTNAATVCLKRRWSDSRQKTQTTPLSLLATKTLPIESVPINSRKVGRILGWRAENRHSENWGLGGTMRWSSSGEAQEA